MQKGIFCLEGNWGNDLKKRSTVEPILQLLELNLKIPFIHRHCATADEFRFYLKEWKKSNYNGYQILYLAFHGEKDALQLHRASYPLSQIADDLGGCCVNGAIVFGACRVLKQDKRHLRRFLERTKAYAVCGYRSNVDWMTSTAFELLLLSELQLYVFDGRGSAPLNAKLATLSKRFKELDFRFVTRG